MPGVLRIRSRPAPLDLSFGITALVGASIGMLRTLVAAAGVTLMSVFLMEDGATRLIGPERFQ